MLALLPRSPVPLLPRLQDRQRHRQPLLLRVRSNLVLVRTHVQKPSCKGRAPTKVRSIVNENWNTDGWLFFGRTSNSDEIEVRETA